MNILNTANDTSLKLWAYFMPSVAENYSFGQCGDNKNLISLRKKVI